MKKNRVTILTIALFFIAAGCEFSNNGKDEPPTANTYSATVISVDMVNKDSGAMLTVEGIPLQGGELAVE